MSYSVKIPDKKKHEYVRDALALLAMEHVPRLSVADYLYKLVKVEALRNKINVKVPE